MWIIRHEVVEPTRRVAAKRLNPALGPAAPARTEFRCVLEFGLRRYFSMPGTCVLVLFMRGNSDILCEASLIASVINLFEEEVTQKSSTSER